MAITAVFLYEMFCISISGKNAQVTTLVAMLTRQVHDFIFSDAHFNPWGAQGREGHWQTQGEFHECFYGHSHSICNACAKYCPVADVLTLVPQAHSSIWQLAKAAIETVDPEFAAAFTALAVTHNFQGSPHIDKQNVGPFYAMALGDFPPGQGGIHVECSARVVAEVGSRWCLRVFHRRIFAAPKLSTFFCQFGF